MESPPIPPEFLVTGMSGDQQTLVGSLRLRPAFWTRDGGMQFASREDPTMTGSLNGISADGRVFYGIGRGARGLLQIWTREGIGYRLAELLPGGVAAGLKGWSELDVKSITADGRTALITAKDTADYTRWSEIGWLAELVFPGDGPRLRIESGDGGRRQVKFSTPPGFRYRCEFSTELGQWETRSDSISDRMAMVSVPLPNGLDAIFARIVTEPVP